MTGKYLYGIAVQGIQKFIFETGKLKEIIGGSEFVEQSCGGLFQKEVASVGTYKPDNVIVSAAGKIIYLFDEEAPYRHITKHYLKSLKSEIPEFSVIQAGISLTDNGLTLKDALGMLEYRLETQRSRMPMSHGRGLMISRRSKRTGKPGVELDKRETSQKDALDRSQVSKRSFSKKNNLISKIDPTGGIEFPTDINEIAGEGEWLAVVHADGNNLGKTVQRLISDPPNDMEVHTLLKDFSSKLNTATQNATQAAFRKVVLPYLSRENQSIQKAPLRPILLGGDDLSLLIRGDLAVDFTQEYLMQFQLQTKKAFVGLLPNVLENGLTACAGIAFIKPNYPIHYGMDLAETLTKYAKKTAKSQKRKDRPNEIPACLAFHKVQSSFVEEIDQIIDRELSTSSTVLSDRVFFNYGPYFLDAEGLDGNYPTIDQLKTWVQILKRKDAPKAGLRNWLSSLHQNRAGAAQIMQRIISRNSEYKNILQLGEEQLFVKRSYKKKEVQVTHIHDVLTLASLSNHE